MMINSQFSDSSSLILVVDDDRSIRTIINSAMTIEGYQTLEADSGKQCLDICQKQTPNLILLDAMMPIMDGFDCCLQLKKLFGYNCPPILMMTVLDDRESIYRSFDVGITDYLVKPINWVAFKQKIKKLLQIQLKTITLKRYLEELTDLKEDLTSSTLTSTQQLSNSSRILSSRVQLF